jgi:hypothetical protein
MRILFMSIAKMIVVSEATYLQVKGAFHFVRRPTRDIKGKGVMQMYFVED